MLPEVLASLVFSLFMGCAPIHHHMIKDNGDGIHCGIPSPAFSKLREELGALAVSDDISQKIMSLGGLDMYFASSDDHYLGDWGGIFPVGGLFMLFPLSIASVLKDHSTMPMSYLAPMVVIIVVVNVGLFIYGFNVICSRYTNAKNLRKFDYIFEHFTSNDIVELIPADADFKKIFDDMHTRFNKGEFDSNKYKDLLASITGCDVRLYFIRNIHDTVCQKLRAIIRTLIQKDQSLQSKRIEGMRGSTQN